MKRYRRYRKLHEERIFSRSAKKDVLKDVKVKGYTNNFCVKGNENKSASFSFMNEKILDF